ncbi:MAG: hypothetical protein AVDCRST_MAG65-1018, partial [uncultured Solirubrobacteraceae bacterium]
EGVAGRPPHAVFERALTRLSARAVHRRAARPRRSRQATPRSVSATDEPRAGPADTVRRAPADRPGRVRPPEASHRSREHFTKRDGCRRSCVLATPCLGATGRAM